MANKDYDDLLEAFMNNSQKTYNEDRQAQKEKKGKLPSGYNTYSNDSVKKSERRGNNPKKQKKLNKKEA